MTGTVTWAKGQDVILTVRDFSGRDKCVPAVIERITPAGYVYIRRLDGRTSFQKFGPVSTRASSTLMEFRPRAGAYSGWTYFIKPKGEGAE